MEVGPEKKTHLCSNQCNKAPKQAISDAEAYNGFSDYIKVNPVTNPIIYVKAAEKLKYIYQGKLADVTANKIVEFIKNVESGKIRKWKMDEETKPKQQQQAQKSAEL